jgi:hypothetical protein
MGAIYATPTHRIYICPYAYVHVHVHAHAHAHVHVIARVHVHVHAHVRLCINKFEPAARLKRDTVTHAHQRAAQ